LGEGTDKNTRRLERRLESGKLRKGVRRKSFVNESRGLGCGGELGRRTSETGSGAGPAGEQRERRTVGGEFLGVRTDLYDGVMCVFYEYGGRRSNGCVS